MIFFAKNKKHALRVIKKYSERDKWYKNKTVVLAKKQIPHISKWKTWKVIKK